MNEYAPVVIFCYRRKIDQLIESLRKNYESKDTQLFIYSDGFKSDKDKNDVINVRKDLKKIHGFKLVHIIESNRNKGLANSIIDGVTEVIKKFDRIIVLEDDLIISEYFLNFMNRSLNHFKESKDIWSVSGYSPKIPYLQNYQKEVYLSLRSSSWGWATWLDRWRKVDWLLSDFDNLKKDKEKIKNFELGGNDMFKMLELQYLGKIDSWAIRWCYSQFLNSSYSVTPKISMTQNKGFDDNLGMHNLSSDPRWKVDLSNSKINNIEVSFDSEIIDNFKKYYDMSFYTRCGYFLRKWGGYNLIKRFISKAKV